MHAAVLDTTPASETGVHVAYSSVTHEALRDAGGLAADVVPSPTNTSRTILAVRFTGSPWGACLAVALLANAAF